jgi:radical SAM superfamily enzyme YgiQ (UPF0313 family)
MTNILIIVLLIIIEALVIALSIIIYKYYQQINNSDNNNLSETADDDKVQKGFLDYVQDQIVLMVTEGSDEYVENIDNKNDIDTLPFGLRKGLLQLEINKYNSNPEIYSYNEHKDEITNLLNEYKIIPALNAMYKQEEYVHDDYKEIIERQEKTIEFLKQYANDILANTLNKNEQILTQVEENNHKDAIKDFNRRLKIKTENMINEITSIETNNNELHQCIGVLEEENQFLRQQIESLLIINEA